MHREVKHLNRLIEQGNPAVFAALSQRGKNIFFPKSGIMSQYADARGKQYNATIGIAMEDDASPMHMPFFDEHIDIDPANVYPYAPSSGVQNLRELWLQMMRFKNPSLQSETSLPVVTNALTHALSIAGFLFVDEGQEIILTDKYWGNYQLIFGHAYGGLISPFNTFDFEGFDTESFAQKMNEKEGRKIVLLNFPNNPTGYTPTADEAENILSILHERAEHGDILTVILDDAYFGLVYEEGVYTESLFAKLADMHRNILAVKIDGATKEDYAWGFRVGFITFGSKGLSSEAYAALENKATGVVRATVSNVSHLTQSMLLNLYRSESYLAQKQQKYTVLRARYEHAKKLFADESLTQFFSPLPFNSGYFFCVQLADGLDGEQVRQKLLAEFDTGIIATKTMIRIAYSSLAMEKIEPLLRNLHVACAELSM